MLENVISQHYDNIPAVLADFTVQALPTCPEIRRGKDGRVHARAVIVVGAGRAQQ